MQEFLEVPYNSSWGDFWAYGSDYDFLRDNQTYLPEQIPVTTLPEISKLTIDANNIVTGSVISIAIKDDVLNYQKVANYTVQSGDGKSQIIDGLINSFTQGGYDPSKYKFEKDLNGDLIITSYGEPAITSGDYTATSTLAVKHTVTSTILNTDHLNSTLNTINATYVAPTTSLPANVQQEKYALSGTIEIGDKYTIAGITYTVQVNDTSISDVVDNLILGLNGGTPVGISGISTLSNSTASKSPEGDILITANTAGIGFSLPNTNTINNSGIDDQTISLSSLTPQTTSTAGLYEKNYSISGFIKKGSGYYLGGAVYVVQNTDTTLSDIMNGLVASINGNTLPGVSGTPLSGVTASISGNQLLLSSTTPMPDYEIRTHIDFSDITTSELEKEINITENGIVTFESVNDKYIKYSQSAYLNDSTQTQIITNVNIESVKSLAMLKSLDYLDSQTAKNYFQIIDESLNDLNSFRANIGSTQNQLESSSRNLLSSFVNIKNAESIIRDVDYAFESQNFSKQNIILQSGNYSLAQANKMPKEILKILLNN